MSNEKEYNPQWCKHHDCKHWDVEYSNRNAGICDDCTERTFLDNLYEKKESN